MKTKIHPGAKWIFRIRVYSSLIFLVIFFGFISFSIIGSTLFGSNGGAVEILSFGLFITLFYLAVAIIIGEVYARMAYNRWFYEFTEEGLKLERGIVWKRYSTIPYGRIQNVDVQRGILARIIGFSTVDIQTAGYHAVSPRYYGGSSMSEGHIPAVAIDSAEKIRAFVLKKISKRQQGL